MVTRRWILLLLSAAMISLLPGCGNNSTFNVENPPPPPQANVSIAFTSTPPAAISIISTPLPTLAATVTNDPNNYGVDWELAVCQSKNSNCNVQLCSGGTNCGALYLSDDPTKTQVAHSASGTELTYQPPSTFPTPGNTMFVEILASATADHTKSVLTPISIIAFGSVLNGTYVFQAQGSDSSGSPYQVAGVLALDGTSDNCSGFITSGQQTLNTVSGLSVTTSILGSGGTPCLPAPTSSSYFIGPDSRGTIMLNLNDPNNPGNPVTETFSLVVLSSSKALIAELDSNSSAGTLELQDPVAAAALPTGGYALVAGGTDSGGTPIAFGGVLNIDNVSSLGSISGNGSSAIQDYFGMGSTSCIPKKGLAGSTVSSSATGIAPGVVVFDLVTSCAPDPFGPTQLTGYIVDTTHIRLVETDSLYLTAGLAISQGSATGTFDPGSFSGPYVFGAQGFANPANGVIPSSFTSVGVICPDGMGTLNTDIFCSYTTPNETTYGGYTDTVFFSDNVPLPGGQNSPCQYPPCPGAISGGLSGTYQADSTGIGSIHLADLKFNPPPGTGKNDFPHPDLHFFLSGPQGSGAPALFIYSEIGASAFYPALGVGIAYPQQQPANALSFGNSELYGVSFTQQGQLSGAENDGTGQMTATSSGGAGALTGTVDDFSNIGAPPIVLKDTFTIPADNFGRIAGTFLAPQQTPPATQPTVEYYLVDPDQGFFVETDLLANLISGAPTEVTLGYFAKACDVTSATDCQQAAQRSSTKPALKTHRLHRKIF
ncbi:MAG: hypothetical protein WA172_00030 [Terriglobales bacterium]